MTRRLALVVPLAALALAGCGSACQDLADRICNCESAGVVSGIAVFGIQSAQDTCKQSVQNQLGSASQQPGPAAEAYCQAKLATCPDPALGGATCQLLKTQEGKVACGVSYPTP